MKSLSLAKIFIHSICCQSNFNLLEKEFCCQWCVFPPQHFFRDCKEGDGQRKLSMEKSFTCGVGNTNHQQSIHMIYQKISILFDRHIWNMANKTDIRNKFLFSWVTFRYDFWKERYFKNQGEGKGVRNMCVNESNLSSRFLFILPKKARHVKGTSLSL